MHILTLVRVSSRGLSARRLPNRGIAVPGASESGLDEGEARVEGIHYLVGDREQILEQLCGGGTWSPGLRAVVDNQIESGARPYVEALLSGEPLYWDRPPLSQEPWEVYASVSGFVAQALRLLATDVGLDVWPSGMRLGWLAADWRPLDREVAWAITCRPLGTIRFAQPRPPIDCAAAYLESWRHGWLSAEEAARVARGLHPLLVELASGLDSLGWPSSDLSVRLAHPERLDAETRFELLNAADGSPHGWQLQRALALLKAARLAVLRDQALFAVGY